MLRVFKNFFGKYRTNKVVHNFFYLALVNIVNYAFPIIIIPFLIVSLGLEVYGKYIFAFTILSYFNLLVQYGFNFSATQKVAKFSNNAMVISETYTAVTVIRLFFSFAIIAIFFAIGFFIPETIRLYLFGVGIFLGQGLIPIWLFQGLEKMKYITIVNTIVRTIAFVMIIVMIKSPQQVDLLMLIQSLSFVLGAVISVFLVKAQLNINFVRPTLTVIKQNLKEGWNLFLSTIGMSLYRQSNVVILGFVAGYSVVGLYTPAEKLIKGVQSFSNIVVTALYPHLSKKIAANRKEGIKQFFKIGKLLIGLFLFFSLGIAVCAPFIIRIYLGDGFPSTILDLRILSAVIFVGGLNYFYGIVGMVNFNKEKLFNRFVWISGVIGMSLSVALSYLFQDVGAAISMTIAEVVLLLFIIKALKRSKWSS